MQAVVHVADEERELSPVPPLEEYPLPIAADWPGLVASAESAASVIDTHLDFEQAAQGRRMTPVMLCSEQRIALATDLMGICR